MVGGDGWQESSGDCYDRNREVPVRSDLPRMLRKMSSSPARGVPGTWGRKAAFRFRWTSTFRSHSVHWRRPTGNQSFFPLGHAARASFRDAIGASSLSLSEWVKSDSSTHVHESGTELTTRISRSVMEERCVRVGAVGCLYGGNGCESGANKES